MFGMGFTEILIIGVIAILFLGPDKLPETMVEIAKFFKNVKSTISSAKESIEEELHVSDIKEGAKNYHQELQQAHQEFAELSSLDTIKDEIDGVKKDMRVNLNDDATYINTEKKEEVSSTDSSEPEVVTFKKRSKSLKNEEKIDNETPTKEA